MFKANSFTTKEWPLFEPYSSKFMSIGEEQGDSTVTAIAWSWPGLARHLRPVLAVLTSNHLLALWASTSDVRESRSWERVLIVNNVQAAASLPQTPSCRRIRSMAWSLPFQRPKCRLDHHRRDRGIHILAVALEDGNLHILKVLSPYNMESKSWRLERLCAVESSHRDSCGVYHAMKDKHNEALSSVNRNRYSLFGIAMEASRFIDTISFGPWTTHEEQAAETVVSFRAATVASSLRLSCTTLDLNHIKFELTELEHSLPV